MWGLKQNISTGNECLDAIVQLKLKLSGKPDQKAKFTLPEVSIMRSNTSCLICLQNTFRTFIFLELLSCRNKNKQDNKTKMHFASTHTLKQYIHVSTFVPFYCLYSICCIFWRHVTWVLAIHDFYQGWDARSSKMSPWPESGSRQYYRVGSQHMFSSFHIMRYLC